MFKRAIIRKTIIIKDIKKKKNKKIPLEHIVVSPREPSLFVEEFELLDGLNRRPVSRRSEVSSKATDGGISYSSWVVETVVQEVNKSRLDLNVG